ncbi:MAG: hypothetical protein ND807_04370 [Vicinamibacterales bacterium]|nr:hypothetical protein [Vicinamibacterales bacterium]
MKRSVCILLFLHLGAMSLLAQQTQQPSAPTFTPDEGRSRILGVVTDSLKLLMLEHGTRIVFQAKTRRELSGPFLKDYGRSVRIPDQWGDTDSGWVNYLGHPIHGAAAGYIWLDHEPTATPDISRDSSYWKARARATAWSAAYSLQFEIGPLSEASIGNVGMRPETTGWVDHIVTPAGAFGLMVAEDALDRFLVKRLEQHVTNRVVRVALRVGLNPGRALSNAATGRVPWHREGRSLR